MISEWPIKLLNKVSCGVDTDHTTMSSPQPTANITEPASAQSPPTTENEAKPNNISNIDSQVASTIVTSPSQHAEPSGQV